jgi:hypothetical protein
MKSAIHWSVRIWRGHIGVRIARLVAAALVAPAPTFFGCANSDRATAVVVEDRELVGLWQGPMRGPWGRSVLTLRLRTDSTMTVDNENRNYSHLDGVWTISNNRLIATGTPGYDVIVTLVASAPFVHLTGTWTSNDASGNFDLAKR